VLPDGDAEEVRQVDRLRKRRSRSGGDLQLRDDHTTIHRLTPTCAGLLQTPYIAKLGIKSGSGMTTSVWHSLSCPFPSAALVPPLLHIAVVGMVGCEAIP